MVFDIRGIPLSVDSIWEKGEAGIPLGKSRVYTRVSQSIDAPTKILVNFGLKIYIIFSIIANDSDYAFKSLLYNGTRFRDFFHIFARFY